MNLDLSDLDEWTDDEVVEALNEIDHGLSDSDLVWLDRFTKQLDAGDPLSPKQRTILELMLERWIAR